MIQGLEDEPHGQLHRDLNEAMLQSNRSIQAPELVHPIRPRAS